VGGENWYQLQVAFCRLGSWTWEGLLNFGIEKKSEFSYRDNMSFFELFLETLKLLDFWHPKVYQAKVKKSKNPNPQIQSPLTSQITAIKNHLQKQSNFITHFQSKKKTGVNIYTIRSQSLSQVSNQD
jgi:hypothetical protein